MYHAHRLEREDKGIEMTIDRSQYMDESEAAHLRRVTAERAAEDLKRGNATGPRIWMIVDFALSCPLRRTEISRILIQDIDFKRGALLNLLRQKKRTDKPTPETLGLGADLLKHLKEYIAWEHGAVTAGPLWIGQRGPLKPCGLNEAWRQAVLRAGLPKSYAHIHCARDTFSTLHYRKYKDLVGLQRILGHESPTVTAQRYVGKTFEELQVSMNGLY
jgi:integrase